jgi:hypothetical protein
MMKAVLIDPFNRTISMIDMGNDWREISARIGCQYFTVAGYYDNDVSIVTMRDCSTVPLSL